MERMDSVSTRAAFGEELWRLAGEDERIVAVSADTARSMGLRAMERDFPDRLINVGIAEQSMMLVAAGLAADGYRAVATTYAPFISMRALEQLRTFVCYPRLDVKLFGGMSGLTGSIEGVTHQGQEDVPILRTLPNLSVIVPADAAATRVIVREVMAMEGPVYVGLGRSESHSVFGEDYRFTPGKANLMRDGADVTVVANGPMVARAVEAAERLRGEGIDVRLLEMPCVKPIDAEAIIRAARETKGIVTAEDRTIVGGLGSAVCEVLCEHCPAPVRRVGLLDTFAESGPEDELFERYHLGVADIVAHARALVARSDGRCV